MPKRALELGPLAVSRLKEPGVHFVGGVAGLALQVIPSGGRSWILRTMVGDRRRDMGLGGYPDVTVAMARDRAREARTLIRSGVDPIEEGRAARSRLKADQAAAKTFDQCAAGYIKTMEKGWRNDKHGQQWRNTLASYASPVIGSLLVRDIGMAQVLAVLNSVQEDGATLWESKPETASRVRNRIELVLNWATTHGYRNGDNPARWRSHLENVLPSRSDLAKRSDHAKVKHHPALPFDEIGEFMRQLRKEEGMGARALEFAILTAARSGEVRGAAWKEIDLKAEMWVIPAQRMKAGREHRIPLPEVAVKLLEALPRSDSPYVFAALRVGQLSDMTLSAVLRRMEVPAVPHGFRSTFRDWVSERTGYPGDMAEIALAHKVGEDVELAYRRGDMLDKRRKMMNDWATFCAKPETASKVIQMKRNRAAS
jgi:integrase